MIDRDNILETDQVYKQQSLDYETTQDQISFVEFLAGRRVVPFPDSITCLQLESDHYVLQELVTQFNPDYEDPRALSKPMSRKRQLEIELNLSTKQHSKKQDQGVNFFVDSYTDDQIQEIISIFRNDFKPPKNLWIERQPNFNVLGSGTSSSMAAMQATQGENNSPDFYQDIYAEAIEQFNQQ